MLGVLKAFILLYFHIIINKNPIIILKGILRKCLLNFVM